MSGSTGPAAGTPRVISTEGLTKYTVPAPGGGTFTFYTSQSAGVMTFSIEGQPGVVTVNFSNGTYTESSSSTG